MHVMKAITMRARKKSGPKKMKHVEYRKADKGKGVISMTHFQQPEGPMASYHSPEEEVHASPMEALSHFKKAFGVQDSTAADKGTPAAPAENEGSESASDAGDE